MSSNDVNEQLLWEQIALKKQSISSLKSSINDNRKDVSSKKKLVNSLLNEIETARSENTPLIDEDDKWAQISTLKSEINTLITSIKNTRDIIKEKENTVEDNIEILQDNALEGVELPPPLEKILTVSRLQVNDNTTIAGYLKVNNNLNVSGDIYFDNSANITNLIVNNNTNLNKLVVDNSTNLTDLNVTNKSYLKDISGTNLDISNNFKVNNKFNLADRFILDNNNNIIVKTNIIPDLSNVYTLGTLEKPFMDLFLGPSSLYINGTKVISADQAEEMKIETTTNQNLTIQTSGSGLFKLQSNADMNLNTVGVNSDINLSTNGGIKINSVLGLVFATNKSIKLNDNKIVLTGDVVIDGSLNISGKQTIINTEALTIKDNIVILNSNQQLNPDVGFQSGFEVIRGNRPKYNFKFRDLGTDGGVFEVGEDGDLQPVATRKESNLMTDKGVLYWDNSNNRLDTFDNVKLNNSNLDIVNGSKLLIGGVDVLGNIDASLNGKLNLTGGSLSGSLNVGTSAGIGQRMNILTSTDTYPTILVASGVGGSSSHGGSIGFATSDNITDERFIGSMIKSLNTFWNGNNGHSAHLAFYTRPNTSTEQTLTTRMIIRDSGSVGINTISPASGVMLDVNGIIRGTELQEGTTKLEDKYELKGAGGSNWTLTGTDIENNNTGEVFVKDGLRMGGSNFRMVKNNYGVYLRQDDSQFWILLTDNGDPNGGWNSLRPLRIDLADGNLKLGNDNLNVIGNKIGMGTTLPSTILELAREISTVGDENLMIHFNNKSSGYYDWRIGPTLTTGPRASFQIKGGANGTSLSTYFNVDGDGNIGIGNIGNPLAPLHIERDSNYPELYINYSGGNKASILTGTGGVQIGYSGYLDFSTITGAQNAGSSLKIRLNSSGDLGINTSSPQEKLDVRGNVYLDNGTDTNIFNGRNTTTYNTGSYSTGNSKLIIGYKNKSTMNGDGGKYVNSGDIILKAQGLNWSIAESSEPKGAEILLESGRSPNGGQVNGAIHFKTGGSTHDVGAGITRMKIEGNGNVIINTNMKIESNGNVLINNNKVAEVYGGTSVNEVDFPIGTMLIVTIVGSTWSSRNQNITVRLDGDATRFNNNSGTAVNGTWRARGMSGFYSVNNTHTILAQRVA